MKKWFVDMAKSPVVVAAFILTVGAIASVMLWACATRYESSRTCFHVISHDKTYPASMDRWTGKTHISVSE